jgi:protein ImuB
MGRLACVDVYALPLQLLIAKRPEWREGSVVVVDEDKPQGLVLWTNRQAYARGILRGMRYAAALSLDGELRAGIVSDAEIEAGQKQILRIIRHYTPRIDARGHTFIIDASGLMHLHPSLEHWARALFSELKSAGFISHIVVGFGRFHCYALALAAHEPVRIFETEVAEQMSARRVPVDRLPLEPRARDFLTKLGVRCVGDLVRLPESGVRKRFSPEVALLLQLARGERVEPLVNTPEDDPCIEETHLDFEETDAERLLFLLKRMLHPLLHKLAERSQAVARLRLFLDREESSIAPAAPALDAALLLDLLRLKIGTYDALKKGIKDVRLMAESVPAERKQLELFRSAHKRDLQALERAFARLRAEFGEGAVCFATLSDGHLPEARFRWAPAHHIAEPTPGRGDTPRLVRRFHEKALPLVRAHRPSLEGWTLGGLERGSVQQMIGPDVISGGWWRKEIQRDYYFVQTSRGDWLWVYFDPRDRCWRQAGVLA